MEGAQGALGERPELSARHQNWAVTLDPTNSPSRTLWRWECGPGGRSDPGHSWPREGKSGMAVRNRQAQICAGGLLSPWRRLQRCRAGSCSQQSSFHSKQPRRQSPAAGPAQAEGAAQGMAPCNPPAITALTLSPSSELIRKTELMKSEEILPE